VRDALTVVVLTYNRPAEVLRTLHELRRLPEAPRIVVVDNGSTRSAADAIAEIHPDVTLVRLPENLGAAGRNHGIAAVTTPYAAFSDDDTWWTPGSLASAARLLDRHPQVGVVCARILVGEAGREDPASTAMAQSPLDDHGLPGRAILGFMAGASVIRTSAFREAGGYCPQLFLGGEEELLALDLAARGWRMVYCPQLTVRHFPSGTRDASGRHALLARNAVWVAGLRLPWRMVARRALAALMDPRLSGTRSRVAWQTLRGLPWILSSRRTVPREIARMRAHIDATTP
jgi:GT2 family glycosyltransferase